jgi:hypothetical protein
MSDVSTGTPSASPSVATSRFSARRGTPPPRRVASPSAVHPSAVHLAVHPGIHFAVHPGIHFAVHPGVHPGVHLRTALPGSFAQVLAAHSVPTQSSAMFDKEHLS